MFYVKTHIGEDCEINTTITDENVFTTCPGCGAEHNVDFVELAHEIKYLDLTSTIYCEDCSKKRG